MHVLCHRDDHQKYLLVVWRSVNLSMIIIIIIMRRKTGQLCMVTRRCMFRCCINANKLNCTMSGVCLLSSDTLDT